MQACPVSAMTLGLFMMLGRSIAQGMLTVGARVR
jgi:hypothetical protein